MNDVRADIKIKKKRKINLLTPWPCWVKELQRWRKGKGGEEEGESHNWKRSWRKGGGWRRTKVWKGGGKGEECEEARGRVSSCWLLVA